MRQKTFYISADIEGITDVTSWCETQKGSEGYEEARIQMMNEVSAACRAILDAGHCVVVRDGHDSARNLEHAKLPRDTMLMRGWACHPGSMVAGIDEKYDGLICIGYHAPAGSEGSPLAHTINLDKINYIKINGKLASEFTINSNFAAQYGVPSIFISGDQAICDLAMEEVPKINTVAVKKCKGNSTFNIHPEISCDLIYKGVSKAISEEIFPKDIPDELILELCLKSHQFVRNALAMPGVEKLDNNTVRYIATSPMELNIMIEYIMR